MINMIPVFMFNIYISANQPMFICFYVQYIYISKPTNDYLFLCSIYISANKPMFICFHVQYIYISANQPMFICFCTFVQRTSFSMFLLYLYLRLSIMPWTGYSGVLTPGVGNFKHYNSTKPGLETN